MAFLDFIYGTNNNTNNYYNSTCIIYTMSQESVSQISVRPIRHLKQNGVQISFFVFPSLLSIVTQQNKWQDSSSC